MNFERKDVIVYLPGNDVKLSCFFASFVLMSSLTREGEDERRGSIERLLKRVPVCTSEKSISVMQVSVVMLGCNA